VIRQATTVLRFPTPGRGLLEITREVRGWLDEQTIGTGLLRLLCRHTSASLLVQENAAAEVRSDLEAFFARLAPENPELYAHNDEGPDDMPAHIRAALTQVQLSVPVMAGQMALGTWQGIYLFEHRHHRHVRELALHLLGE
jgi:secondary thiamine-phosphate synthase enzyme